MLGVRARRRGAHRVRDRRLLLEHAAHPVHWIHRGAEDDLLEQGVPRQCRLPQGPHLHRHQRSRAELQADGGELPGAGVRAVEGALARAGHGARRRRRHHRLAPRPRQEGRAHPRVGARPRRQARARAAAARARQHQRERVRQGQERRVRDAFDLHRAGPALRDRRQGALVVAYLEDKPPLDTSQIESKVAFYASKDGTRVPMFLTYRKGTKPDGTNPVFLHGYGGFNIGIGPDYVRSWATFINRGVLSRSGYPRRRRVRRALARRGQVRQQAEQLRRLHRRGRVARARRATRRASA